jgi:hypothetical protein
VFKVFVVFVEPKLSISKLVTNGGNFETAKAVHEAAFWYLEKEATHQYTGDPDGLPT